MRFENIEERSKTFDPRNILALPEVYGFFNNLVSGDAQAVLVRDFVRAKKGDRVLDIGCGPGRILDHLPEGINYLGADMSERYIAYARKKYDGRGEFVCQRVDKEAFKDKKGFDIVLARGLIHHINDDEAADLFNIAHFVLRAGGRFITFDGCYVDGQSPIAKFLLSHDRGKYVRDRASYEKIAARKFSDIKVTISHTMMRIPATAIIMECTKI
jgi:SAM-dependent methyltransferase